MRGETKSGIEISLVTRSKMRQRVETKVQEMRQRFPLPKNRVLPWVGRACEESPRVLILGESAYEDDDDPDSKHYKDPAEIAIAVLEIGRAQIAGCYVDESGKRILATGNFIRNIFKYMTGRKPEQGRAFVDCWERWAFWELIQHRLKGRRKPSQEEFEEGWQALHEVADGRKWKPDLTIGLGYRMRDSVKKDKLLPRVGADGFFDYLPANLPVLFVHHPSYRRTDPSKEHNKIDQALRQLGFQGPPSTLGFAQSR